MGQPARQHRAADLGVTEPRTLLRVPVDPPQQRVHIHEGPGAGQQRCGRGQFDQQPAGRGLELADMAELNSRRNDPKVDGAYTGPNSSPIPPRRNASTSLIEFAPTTTPATIVATFPAGLEPIEVPNRTRWATSVSRPVSWGIVEASATPIIPAQRALPGSRHDQNRFSAGDPGVGCRDSGRWSPMETVRALFSALLHTCASW